MKIFFTALFLFTVSLAFAQTNYKNYCGVMFCVDLPAHFQIENFDDNNADYEIHFVKLKDGFEVITLSSMLEGRVSMDASISSVKDLFDYVVKNSKDKVSYKFHKDNWYVISGTRAENGNTFYYKCIWEGEFVRDLLIEYPASRKAEIEPYIGTISKSFK